LISLESDLRQGYVIAAATEVTTAQSGCISCDLCITAVNVLVLADSMERGFLLKAGCGGKRMMRNVGFVWGYIVSLTVQ
jgi:hypothetical protein